MGHGISANGNWLEASWAGHPCLVKVHQYKDNYVCWISWWSMNDENLRLSLSLFISWCSHKRGYGFISWLLRLIVNFIILLSLYLLPKKVQNLVLVNPLCAPGFLHGGCPARVCAPEQHVRQGQGTTTGADWIWLVWLTLIRHKELQLSELPYDMCSCIESDSPWWFTASTISVQLN